jgi:hypothetical protein
VRVDHVPSSAVQQNFLLCNKCNSYLNLILLLVVYKSQNFKIGLHTQISLVSNVLPTSFHDLESCAILGSCTV